MSSYFDLALDTTGPNITIVAPTYTIPGIMTEIDVLSDEHLMNTQEIYLIDSQGHRYDVTFDYLGDYFHGAIDLACCAYGMVTIYARLTDDYGNQSDLATATIAVRLASDKLKVVNINAITRGMVLSALSRDMILSASTRDVIPSVSTRDMILSASTRGIHMEVSL